MEVQFHFRHAALLLVVVLFQVTVSFPTTSQDGCVPCQPGYYDASDCSDGQTSVCLPCEKGSFTAELRHQTVCQVCQTCSKGDYPSRVCTSTSDAVCVPCSQIPMIANAHYAPFCVDSADKGSDVDGMQGDDPNALVTASPEVTSEPVKVEDTTPETKPEPMPETTPEVIKVEETTPEVIKVEESTPEVIKVEETTPEPIIVEETTPEPIKIEETTPEPIKIEETTPEPIKIEETTPEPNKIEETTQELIIVEETTPEVIKIEETTPEVIKVEETTEVVPIVETTEVVPIEETTEVVPIVETTPEAINTKEATTEITPFEETTTEFIPIEETTPEANSTDGPPTYLDMEPNLGRVMSAEENVTTASYPIVESTTAPVSSNDSEIFNSTDIPESAPAPESNNNATLDSSTETPLLSDTTIPSNETSSNETAALPMIAAPSNETSSNETAAVPMIASANETASNETAAVPTIEPANETASNDTAIMLGSMPLFPETRDVGDVPDANHTDNSSKGGDVEMTTKIATLEELEAANHGDDGSGSVDYHLEHQEDHHNETGHSDGHAGAAHGDTEEDEMNKKKTAIIVGVAVGGVAIFALLFFTTRKCRKQAAYKPANKAKDDGIEFRPLSQTNSPPIFTGNDDASPTPTNGIYRHGPKMGPPSPRMHRKGDGKFEFPQVHAAPPKGQNSLSVSASPMNEAFLKEDDEFKYIDESTDDEQGGNTMNEKLLPESTLSQVIEMSPPSSPAANNSRP